MSFFGGEVHTSPILDMQHVMFSRLNLFNDEIFIVVKRIKKNTQQMTHDIDLPKNKTV